MTIKTFTYKRILNIGNYESKHLEAVIEVNTNLQDYAEEECTELMEMVERKIREDHSDSVKQEIASLEREVQQLRKTREALKSLVESKRQESEALPVEHYLNDENVGEGGDF